MYAKMSRARRKECYKLMIKLEHVVLASPEQMEFIIEGMRNPMNSWEKSDSGIQGDPFGDIQGDLFGKGRCENFSLGCNDHSLMQRLSNAGTEHRKYMRMMPVFVRITAPLYWWKEFDTYKVGTVVNSCSTMHKIHDKEFEMSDFSCELLFNNVHGLDNYDFMKKIVDHLEANRKMFLALDGDEAKVAWHQMIQLLPSSYNQNRNVMLNYEVLANIYRQRKNHKLDEWREFCEWIKELPYSELITGENDD